MRFAMVLFFGLMLSLIALEAVNGLATVADAGELAEINSAQDLAEFERGYSDADRAYALAKLQEIFRLGIGQGLGTKFLDEAHRVRLLNEAGVKIRPKVEAVLLAPKGWGGFLAELEMLSAFLPRFMDSKYMGGDENGRLDKAERHRRELMLGGWNIALRELALLAVEYQALPWPH